MSYTIKSCSGRSQLDQLIILNINSSNISPKGVEEANNRPETWLLEALWSLNSE